MAAIGRDALRASGEQFTRQLSDSGSQEVFQRQLSAGASPAVSAAKNPFGQRARKEIEAAVDPVAASIP